MSRKWLLRSAPVAVAILLLAMMPAGAFAQTTGGSLEGKAMQESSAVPVVTGPQFDLTPDVIAGLDGKMTSYKVSLTPAAPAAAGATP